MKAVTRILPFCALIVAAACTNDVSAPNTTLNPRASVVKSTTATAACRDGYNLVAASTTLLSGKLLAAVDRNQNGMICVSYTQRTTWSDDS